MPRISALPSLTTVDGADEQPVVDVSASTTKKATKADYLKDAPSYFNDSSIGTDLLSNSSVTPAKRSGGFKTGVIASTTFSTTGNKAITGLGFKPKMVRFTILPSASTTSVVYGSGVMDEAGNTSWVFTSSTTNAFARESGSTGSVVIVIRTSGTNTPLVTANYTSMDADGFTINVTTPGNVYPVAWEAYA